MTLDPSQPESAYDWIKVFKSPSQKSAVQWTPDGNHILFDFRDESDPTQTYRYFQFLTKDGAIVGQAARIKDADIDFRARDQVTIAPPSLGGVTSVYVIFRRNTNA